MSNQLIHQWFSLWESGDFHALPLTDNFAHTSPYGTIEGKAAYMDLVEANKAQFLGNRFEIHEVLTDGNKACARYTMHALSFSMEVSEWFYFEGDLIREIVSYYNIEGEISEDRKLEELD